MSIQKLDYKKAYKELYMPKTTPMLVDVPEMIFIQVEGAGDPNTCKEYKDAIEVLYGLTYSIKMSKMSGNAPEGYFEYVVPPLEGLWWVDDTVNFDYKNLDKSKFRWISMIRQPEFVTEEVFAQAKATLLKKKPNLDLSGAKLVKYTEGLCYQVMHIGPYDDEPATVEKMERCMLEAGYICDFESGRFHHEIYLGDPRKTAPERLKTVIRHPVRKADSNEL